MKPLSSITAGSPMQSTTSLLFRNERVFGKHEEEWGEEVSGLSDASNALFPEDAAA